jgi:hypothetical protein
MKDLRFWKGISRNEQLSKLADDASDIAWGWCRPMTDDERALEVRTLILAAYNLGRFGATKNEAREVKMRYLREGDAAKRQDHPFA